MFLYLKRIDKFKYFHSHRKSKIFCFIRIRTHAYWFEIVVRMPTYWRVPPLMRMLVGASPNATTYEAKSINIFVREHYAHKTYLNCSLLTTRNICLSCCVSAPGSVNVSPPDILRGEITATPTTNR